MRRLRRTVLLLVGVVALVCAGCARTYSLTIEMTPDSVASVKVTGAKPFAMVHNEGPGAVRATFDADHELAQSVSVAEGTARGRTLYGTKEIRIESSDASTTVRVAVQRATALVIDAASTE
ncbi:MAG: hypothetical protein ACYTGG_13805 [Planctomycetota bacterium]|jgi:hypothetical protein